MEEKKERTGIIAYKLFPLLPAPNAHVLSLFHAPSLTPLLLSPPHPTFAFHPKVSPKHPSLNSILPPRPPNHTAIDPRRKKRTLLKKYAGNFCTSLSQATLPPNRPKSFI